MDIRQRILAILEKNIPQVEPFLNYSNPFELLVAVILSAQCTDVQVNKITAHLFSKYKTPRDFAALSHEQLSKEIKGCGLYRNKSLYIIKTASILARKYNGAVPENLNDLQSLPGVGRKTANVVLSLAFGQPTFPVDTHIYRVSRRMGLSGGNTPRQVEKDLTELIEANTRGLWHHRLIHFGRTTCTARRPGCASCAVNKYCQYTKKRA